MTPDAAGRHPSILALTRDILVGFFLELIGRGVGGVEIRAGAITASLSIANASLGIFDSFDLLINCISFIRSDGRKRDRQTDEQGNGETKPELRRGSRGLKNKTFCNL